MTTICIYLANSNLTLRPLKQALLNSWKGTEQSIMGEDMQAYMLYNAANVS